jgi:hypothetical protein
MPDLRRAGTCALRKAKRKTWKGGVAAAYQARQATFTGGFANFRRATVGIGQTEELIEGDQSRFSKAPARRPYLEIRWNAGA